MSVKDPITVFEHQAIKKGHSVAFDKVLPSLQSFHGQGLPYYSLINNGVKFNEFVGVLQIGDTLIEILPKCDANEDQQLWRDVLIGMLRSVGVFDIHAPSSSSLTLQSNSVLDLYFELFVKEVEWLMHSGLIKRYREQEGNLTALKGRLNFTKHLALNVVHKERFFVTHTVYDRNNILNQLLFKTLKLLHRINSNPLLSSRIGSLLVAFPEVDDVKVSESAFERILFSRKTESYRAAIGMARLLLLNYHPDVREGKNDVLAIMFDMNLLWEQFVLVSLRKHLSCVKGQARKDFWKPKGKRIVQVKPDVVVNEGGEDCIVLDAKWKYLGNSKPSTHDLRQMYVYSVYYNACQTALIYPGPESLFRPGDFHGVPGLTKQHACGILSISVDSNIKAWQKRIADTIVKLPLLATQKESTIKL